MIEQKDISSETALADPNQQRPSRYHALRIEARIAAALKDTQRRMPSYHSAIEHVRIGPRWSRDLPKPKSS